MRSVITPSSWCTGSVASVAGSSTKRSTGVAPVPFVWVTTHSKFVSGWRRATIVWGIFSLGNAGTDRYGGGGSGAPTTFDLGGGGSLSMPYGRGSVGPT